MSWNKVIAASTFGALLALAPCLGAFAAPACPAPPAIDAATAVLIDADSGQVLYERNCHGHRPMASTTKIMTSLLAVESGRLDEIATISPKAAAVGEASIGAVAGEHLSVRDLLYGVLLNSGNDAAEAVAEELGGGSESQFVEMMNQKAHDLGLNDTHFSNPNGLPIANHYSSAYDLAMMLREAIQQPEWTTIATTKVKKIPYKGKPDARLLHNHDKLLWTYPYALCGKTGYTFAAGRCFVGAARHNGRTVISAVLADPAMWVDTQRLMTYGLDAFENVVIARKGEVVGTVPIQSARNSVVEVVSLRDVSVSVPKGQASTEKIQQDWQLPDDLAGPVGENQQVGKLVVRSGNRILTTVPLVAARAVNGAATTWDHIQSWFFPGMLVASAFSLLRLQKGKRRRAKRRKIASGPRRRQDLVVGLSKKAS